MMIQLQGVSPTCSKAILALQVVIIPPPVIVTLWESLKQVRVQDDFFYQLDMHNLNIIGSRQPRSHPQFGVLYLQRGETWEMPTFFCCYLKSTYSVPPNSTDQIF